MNSFVIFLVLTMISVSFISDGFAQFPRNDDVVSGKYVNEKFGFSVTIPNSLDGFLTEIDNPSVGNLVNLQIHPEMEDEICCPSVDTSPIVILLENHPKEYYSTPVPITNGILSAFQGYGMNVTIDNLGNYPVLISTIGYEREHREFPEPVKRVGKFYFINTGDRHISYGILASEENYEKYIDAFENSAQSLTAENVTGIVLDELFPDKNFQAELRLDDNSSIFPKIITPSTVISLDADKQTNSLQINFTEPNDYRSFLAINIGDLLEGPYNITLDGKPVDSQILENESGKYLIVFYYEQGKHSIDISGISVNSTSNPSHRIEKINDVFYYVSEPITLNSDHGRVIFQDVIFRPYVNEPPLQTYPFATFGEEKETFFVGVDEPIFSERLSPQAGFVQRHDGYHFLVSVDLKEMSPLKQDRMGVKFQDILCDDGLELVGKIPYAHPKCIKPDSVEKLTMRGWATTNKILELTNPTKYVVEKNGTDFELLYSLNGAMLKNITHDVDANSVHVSFSESTGGQITISIPRELTDVKIEKSNVDDMLIVLIDGMEYLYGEKITDDERIITVWFPTGTHDIEIIGFSFV